MFRESYYNTPVSKIRHTNITGHKAISTGNWLNNNLMQSCILLQKRKTTVQVWIFVKLATIKNLDYVYSHLWGYNPTWHCIILYMIYSIHFIHSWRDWHLRMETEEKLFGLKNWFFTVQFAHNKGLTSDLSTGTIAAQEESRPQMLHSNKPLQHNWFIPTRKLTVPLLTLTFTHRKKP